MNDTSSPSGTPQPSEDRRLYVLDGGWSAVVHLGGTSHYCYSQNVGEDYYHLILSGEIYMTDGDVKYCLNCALRHGIITTDRLAWSQRSRRGRQVL